VFNLSFFKLYFLIKIVMEIKPEISPMANIVVVGVGGSGNNAINRMVKAKFGGVTFISVNTDAQALHHSEAHRKIHIGKNTTKGLGAGSDPEVGKKAAEEDIDEIKQVLEGADMVFITCGMGGGTGTGAAPIIADIAHNEVGALTIGVVTKPFSFEGVKRAEASENGIRTLKEKVDSLIVVPNDKLLTIIDRKTSLIDSFGIVDDVLLQGVQGISDLITNNGMINVDFADVRTIMKGAGSALMGIGYGAGEGRAEKAARSAIDSPLLELSIEGAKGILMNITGGEDMSMFEVGEAAKVISEVVHPEANIIFGTVIDETFTDEIKITVIATGFDENTVASSNSKLRSVFSKAGTSRNGDINYFGKDGSGVKPATKNIATKFEGGADAPSENDDDEYDVPAFIRNKVS